MNELLKLYGEELRKRITAHPEQYMDTPEGAPALALKMLTKIKGGSVVSLNSNPALKAACKKLNITSYKDLAAYLEGV